jgi:hypothetical protein
MVTFEASTSRPPVTLNPLNVAPLPVMVTPPPDELHPLPLPLTTGRLALAPVVDASGKPHDEGLEAQPEPLDCVTVVDVVGFAVVVDVDFTVVDVDLTVVGADVVDGIDVDEESPTVVVVDPQSEENRCERVNPCHLCLAEYVTLFRCSATVVVVGQDPDEPSPVPPIPTPVHALATAMPPTETAIPAPKPTIIFMARVRPVRAGRSRKSERLDFLPR